MQIQLSEQSLDALAEIISGGSANDGEPSVGLYRQGWKLEAWFKAFGVPLEIGKESRVPATKTALRLAAFLDKNDLLQRIVERAADPRDFVKDPDRHTAVMDYLNRHLEFDGLRLDRVGHVVRLTALAIGSQAVESLAAKTVDIDFDTAKRDLDRALGAADTDPEIAVTAACAIIESVCRSILVELDAPLPAKQDISGLYRAVREPLGLSPTKEGLSEEIVNDVKAVLSGLVTAVQSIGALRTHAGGAHGKERGFRRIDARIAKLAIHSASAVALFLIETWQLRFPGRRLPRKA
jgi:hypothetical protein